MRPGGPRTPTGDMAHFGVYYAVVTQNKDEELNQARIKVRLPWMPEGDRDQTHWAQLATPMAGDKFGWYALPEIGDVVAVMFIAGDIRHPVILGGVWSKVDKPVEETNNFRGYRSRSGHRLIFDETSSTKLVFSDKTNKNVVALGSFSKGGDGPNATEPPKPAGAGSSGVTISAMDGNLNITCPKGTLKVTGTAIKLNAKTAVEIKSTGELTVQGATGAVSSGGMANFDGSSNKIN